MDNLSLWEAARFTDPKPTKEFSRSGGFKGRATNPTYLMRRATEVFGPIGRSRARERDRASLGRRSRVAHMPSATTATAPDASSGLIEEDGAGQPSNQERRSSGPADGVQFMRDTADHTETVASHSHD